ncbi:MAG: ribonuclease J, partial [Candidatus Scatosoma sp.]
MEQENQSNETKTSGVFRRAAKTVKAGAARTGAGATANGAGAKAAKTPRANSKNAEKGRTYVSKPGGALRAESPLAVSERNVSKGGTGTAMNAAFLPVYENKRASEENVGGEANKESVSPRGIQRGLGQETAVPIAGRTFIADARYMQKRAREKARDGEKNGDSGEKANAVKTVAKSAAKNKKAVKIIFLGGVGEIGKNMTAIEYGNDIIVVDAGLTFPNNEDMPGIDLVVPDITYLVQNKEKVRGVLLTHGHEDHIGGVPYLMKELDAGTPLYGTKLTLMLADNKLQENRVAAVPQRVVEAGDVVKLGAFEVEFINVNHSISGAVALAIRTPAGLIFHSGDFKIDLTPVSGKPIDLDRIAALGREGVLLYLGESTNIERMGYTMSETVVGTTLDHLFAENRDRRLIVATFASNVHRLQQIIDRAVQYGRKVALSGRSMIKVVDAAVKIGELKIPEGILVDLAKNKNLFGRELVILSTGTQG